MNFLVKLSLLALLSLLPLLAQAAEPLKLRGVQSVATDDKGGELKNPEGVACNEKQAIVADTGNGRLVRYLFQEEGLKGGSEIKLAQLAAPARVQLGAAGEIFVLDTKHRKIVRLKEDGTFAGYVEGRGSIGQQGMVPRSFKLDAAGNVWVLDLLGNRVVQLDRAGNVQRQWELPKNGFFSDLAVTPTGDLLVLDSSGATVYIARKGEATFTPLSQSLREYVSYVTYLGTDSRGIIHIVDQNGGSLISLAADGSFLGRQLTMGVKPGLVSYPGQVCLNSGALIVADRNNNRIQLFSLGR